MWIKNLCVYHSNDPFPWSAAELEEKLGALRCPKISQQQLSVDGFVAPLKAYDNLIHATDNLLCGVWQETSRLLPGGVIKEELEERLDAIEARDGRRPGRKEKAALKDEITFELMPRAFTRQRRVWFLIDLQEQRILIDSASESRAEQVIVTLRKALGSLPVTRADAEISPALLMTHWLNTPATLPAGLGLGDRCELKGTGESAPSVRFTAFELPQDDILSHLDAGMQVVKLNLSFQDEIEFDLTDSAQIKRLRPLDLIRENLDNIQEEDPLAELLTRISLQGDSLRKLLTTLNNTLTDSGEERHPAATLSS
jgi:recombination associated protein RdgC